MCSELLCLGYMRSRLSPTSLENTESRPNSALTSTLVSWRTTSNQHGAFFFRRRMPNTQSILNWNAPKCLHGEKHIFTAKPSKRHLITDCISFSWCLFLSQDASEKHLKTSKPLRDLTQKQRGNQVKWNDKDIAIYRNAVFVSKFMGFLFSLESKMEHSPTSLAWKGKSSVIFDPHMNSNRKKLQRFQCHLLFRDGAGFFQHGPAESRMWLVATETFVHVYWPQMNCLVLPVFAWNGPCCEEKKYGMVPVVKKKNKHGFYKTQLISYTEDWRYPPPISFSAKLFLGRDWNSSGNEQCDAVVIGLFNQTKKIGINTITGSE